MELKKLQTQVSEIFFVYLKEHKIKNNDDYLLVKLGEEVGELMQAYLIHKKQCRPVKLAKAAETKKNLAKELSDVLCLVLVISKAMNVDIEEAVQKKWISREWIKK
jgi:NTP pyrophosphatase (non-canonical NTP hydrolase)